MAVGIDYSKPYEQLTPEEKERLIKQLYSTRQARKAVVKGRKQAITDLIGLHPVDFEKLCKKHGVPVK